eukprot:364444-Chlamydomonas_euryale.AAC.15
MAAQTAWRHKLHGGMKHAGTKRMPASHACMRHSRACSAASSGRVRRRAAMRFGQPEFRHIPSAGCATESAVCCMALCVDGSPTQRPPPKKFPEHNAGSGLPG